MVVFFRPGKGFAHVYMNGGSQKKIMEFSAQVEGLALKRNKPFWDRGKKIWMHIGIQGSRKMKDIEGDWTWRLPMKYVAKFSQECERFLLKTILLGGGREECRRCNKRGTWKG